MNLIRAFQQLFMRFRYPVSMPEDVAEALGIHLSNQLTFKDFVSNLSGSEVLPTKLSKFMPREMAEQAFCKAIRKERFCEKTLVSYYFPQGWVEFILQFDQKARLRRLYLLHREVKNDQGVEIKLNSKSGSPMHLEMANLKLNNSRHCQP